MGFLKDFFVDVFLCSCIEKKNKKTDVNPIQEDDDEYYESHV